MEKILTENDCFIYEVPLSGISPSAVDSPNSHELHEKIASERSKGKKIVKVGCHVCEKIIRDALNVGLTESELKVFIEKFKDHEYQKLVQSPHFDKNTYRLNTRAFLDEIFGIAASFDTPGIGDYFLQSVMEEIERDRSNPASDTMILKKQFEKRRKAVTSKLKVTKRPNEKRVLPEFEGVLRYPERIPSLWKHLTSQQETGKGETEIFDEGGYIGSRERNAAPLMGVAEGLRASSQVKPEFTAREVYQALCKRYNVEPSTAPHKAKQTIKFKDVFNWVRDFYGKT